MELFGFIVCVLALHVSYAGQISTILLNKRKGHQIIFQFSHFVKLVPPESIVVLLFLSHFDQGESVGSLKNLFTLSEGGFKEVLLFLNILF